MFPFWSAHELRADAQLTFRLASRSLPWLRSIPHAGYGLQTSMEGDDEFDGAFFDIDDDTALDILDREEQKFAATQRADHSPPAKRQKIGHHSPSIDQYSQLPIVLGLEDDYFTRTKAVPLHQRNEGMQPSVAKPKPPHRPAQSRPSVHGSSPVVSTQLSQSPKHQQQQPSRPQPLSLTRQSSISGPGPPQPPVVPEPQGFTRHQKQQSWDRPSRNSAVGSLGPFPSQQKLHSVGPSKPTTPTSAQQGQHAPQRQSLNRATPNTHSRNLTINPQPPQAPSAHRRLSATGGQMQPAPALERHDTLKRQNSSNNVISGLEETRHSKGGNIELRMRLELDILKEQLEQVRVSDAFYALHPF